MMAFPVIPERLRIFFDQHTPGFWSWWQQSKGRLDKIESFATTVDITNPQDGDILVYDSAAGKWKNQQP